MTKSSCKFTQKIIHVDNMMIHNFAKIYSPNSISFVRYKNNKFLINIWTAFWLEFCYFYISQIKSSLDKIFYKIVYHHIIYLCDFFGKFRRLFFCNLHKFSRNCKTRCVPYKKRPEIDGYSSKPAHHAKSVPASRTGEFQKLFVFVAAAGLAVFSSHKISKLSKFSITSKY